MKCLRSIAVCILPLSLSSRRAWIEMMLVGFPLSRYTVALLTEGVD